jgi:hypothetical protein
MKIGIVMTIKDRVELTVQSLRDLINSKLPGVGVILLIDDGSNKKNSEVLMELHSKIAVIRHDVSIGVKRSLIEGIEYCWAQGCDIVTNLDNDVRLKPNWLTKLLELREKFPTNIITGFHSVTRNSDGSERHEIIQTRLGWCSKKSVGGINMMFNKQVYESYIKPALETPEGNWDYIACCNSVLDDHLIITAVPSVIQHTGILQSSMGHNQELPDTAADWYDLELPDVTLIGVDCNHFDELLTAAQISMRSIKFGAVKLLTSDLKYQNVPNVKIIDQLTSKEAYSNFVVKQLYKYVNTSHLLIIQGDGYIINPAAWNWTWLEYDYIGATWLYKDNINVGNGGFSLRSKSFHVAAAKDKRIEKIHPEDFQLCRTYRQLLEYEYGFIYAPEEIANQFSIEAYGSNAIPGANKYSGQFGFHGYNIDWSDWNGHVPNQPKKKIKHQSKISDIWEEMR